MTTNSPSPIHERRRRATQWFLVRVCLLMLLIGGVSYAAWFAPWARKITDVNVEIVR